nr:hypothetical protein [Mycoplasmopsis bovis]
MLKYDIIKAWRSRKWCKKTMKNIIEELKGEYLSIGGQTNKRFV